ncbi:MAG: 30S ribosome-binding factor RbfA [Firmicutes bacterium]|nr:30S ribosome-binding factor RbfA [Bacillota bacterium]
MSLRGGRVAEAMKEEISDIIHNHLKDPRIGFASITGVEVSGDLRHARVFVSVLGDDRQKQDTLRGLESAVGFVRSEIGKRIRMRHTPEIVFKLDESIERGIRVSRLIDQEKRGGQ